MKTQKPKKEKISVTFDFYIEYETLQGRKEALNLARTCCNHVMLFGDFGAVECKIAKKKGMIVGK